MTLPPVTCLFWVACSLHITCQALCSGRADASHSGAASHHELTSPKLALLPLSCLEVPFPARGHVCSFTCSDSCIVLLLHRHSQPAWWGLACGLRDTLSPDLAQLHPGSQAPSPWSSAKPFFLDSVLRVLAAGQDPGGLFKLTVFFPGSVCWSPQSLFPSQSWVSSISYHSCLEFPPRFLQPICSGPTGALGVLVVFV